MKGSPAAEDVLIIQLAGICEAYYVLGNRGRDEKDSLCPLWTESNE